MPVVMMPRLSDSMEEGTIARWLVEDSTEVECGTGIAEIETDKATMEFQSEFAGTLHILAGEGETLAVGAAIARVEGPGDASNHVELVPAPTEAAASAAAPRATTAPTIPSTPATGDAPAAGRVAASPVARRVAQTLRMDLAALTGTGPGGRVGKRDVLRASGRGSASLPAPDLPATVKGETVVQELSRVQATIARVMTEAKDSMPEFTLEVDVDMQAAVALRAEIKALDGTDVPSLNDFVVRACALALRRHPRANGAYREGRFELYDRVNVGIAVATSGRLFVPTVFDADRGSLTEIARETRRLTMCARAGRLTAPELSSGTFTVSNLGMFGITRFTAVLNPPQAAILAVGALEQRAVVSGGEVVAAFRMSLTLTCDHRILYGAEAAEFLAEIRANLEAPLRLTL